VQQETGLGQNNHRGAQNTDVSIYVLLFSFLFFFVIFFKHFFIFFSFAATHKKKTHQVLDFLCNDASSGISTSLPKNRNKCLENEKSYFQAEFGNFKSSKSGKAGKNRMRNLIPCDLKKMGPIRVSRRKLRLF
jgi:hypothetical protein